MASEQEESDAVFEEEEVLWAKIRGYPWWPAFVDRVHPITKGQEAEYTVFFFGDNTNSKLGASKLRKFYQHYVEFYLKARPHRRLMASIQMAEEKLAQNDQNVQIFEALRSSMKVKPKGGKCLSKKESHRSEREVQQAQIEAPNLLKAKTQGCVNNSTNAAFEDVEKKEQKTRDNKIEVQDGSKLAINQQKQSSSENKSKRQQSPALQQEQQNRLEEQLAALKIVQQPNVPEVIDPIREQAVEMVVDSQPRVKQESEEEQSIQQWPSQEQVIRKNKRRLIVKQKSIDQRFRKVPRKRGRPKKIDSDDHLPSVKLHPQRRIQRLRRKITDRVARDRSPEMERQQDYRCSPQLIETVRELCNNREDLIDFLSSIQITVHNVKEILDLDVSNILQDGVITQQIVELLEMMKAALLFKYFPDDLKHKKKYRQLSKKVMVALDGENEESKEREEVLQSQNKMEEQQIRKKTIVKLQKFLKGHPEVEKQAKEMAVRIESYFEQADGQIGQKYKTIAFKVLKSLKEKSHTCPQVIAKLDQHAYD